MICTVNKLELEYYCIIINGYLIKYNYKYLIYDYNNIM